MLHHFTKEQKLKLVLGFNFYANDEGRSKNPFRAGSYQSMGYDIARRNHLRNTMEGTNTVPKAMKSIDDFKTILNMGNQDDRYFQVKSGQR